MTKATLPPEKKVSPETKVLPKATKVEAEVAVKKTEAKKVEDKKPENKKAEVKKQPITKSTAKKPVIAKVKKTEKKEETVFLHHAGKSGRVQSISM